MHIEAVGKTRQNSPLTDAIGHMEGFREFIVPSYIGVLVDVYKDQEYNEDGGKSSFQKLLKENRVFNQVECFRHIHEATALSHK